MDYPGDLDERATTYDDVIVCPACGHRHDCSYEWFFGGAETAEVDCEHCEAALIVTQVIDIEYRARLAGKEGE